VKGRTEREIPQPIMALTLAEVEDIRAELFADDIEIPLSATSWSRERVIEFFESGGDLEAPPIVAAPAAFEVRGCDDGLPPVPSSKTSTLEQAKTLAAPISYKVVHSFVRVRRAPDLQAPDVGLVRKDAVVSVDGFEHGWVRLAEDDQSGYGGSWMLTDGKARQIGLLLKPHVIELANGTWWQVTRPSGCVGHATLPPVGDSAPRPLADCTLGKRVEVLAECGLWARIKVSTGHAYWVEMDAFFAG
jgi:SH3-like domain-containing protein